MSEILNVEDAPYSDDSIIKKDYHSYVPYIRSFKNNDEFRITIQNRDLYVLPSESYIYVEGVITSSDGKLTANARLRNNCVAYLFDEIRYELNGIEIDRTRYLGAWSIIKNFVSLTSVESNIMKNAGWTNGADLNRNMFNFCIPLKMLLGFAEDYNKVILNSKHDLIMLRSSSNQNACYSTDSNEKLNVEINNITWRIPHVRLADSSKLQTMRIINNGKPLPIAFRSWYCHFNPTFQGATKCHWNVKLSTNRERPRFILLALEKEGKFIHSNLVNVKVHLNSEAYPYDDLNLKFDENRYAVLYDMYAKFQQNYFLREPQPILSWEEFKENPIVVIDVSHQNEVVKSGPIDVQVEFETNSQIPAGVAAYCLILHDRLIDYNPLNGIVRKML